MTRRLLSDDLIATRGNLDIMLVGSGTDLSTPYPSIRDRGQPPDAVAYPGGIIVKVIDGIDGPLRVRIVLADRGDRAQELPLPWLSIGRLRRKRACASEKDESDTGWTVLKPSLPDVAPLKICVTVLERTVVPEITGTVDMPSVIEIQVGDYAPRVLEQKSDDEESWRELIEPND